MNDDGFTKETAEKYINGEATIGEVLFASVKDKAFLGIDVNPFTAIENARTAALMDEVKTSIGCSVLNLIMWCVISKYFSKFLYFIGIFVFPFIAPYLMYKFYFNDLEQSLWLLFGGCLMAMFARKNKIGLTCVLLSMFAISLMLLDVRCFNVVYTPIYKYAGIWSSENNDEIQIVSKSKHSISVSMNFFPKRNSKMTSKLGYNYIEFFDSSYKYSRIYFIRDKLVIHPFLKNELVFVKK